MLRAEISDLNFKYMIKDKIEDVDDFYVLLINELLEKEFIDSAEIWYWGKPSFNFTYESGLRMRCFESFNSIDNSIDFDIIFARGGFLEYVPVLKLFKNAKRIYYGAGARFSPPDGLDYDLILTDTIERLSINESKFPNSKHRLFLKGYKPPKLFDVVVKYFDICNVTSIPINKGQEVLAKAIDKTELNFLNIGDYNMDMAVLYDPMNSIFTGSIERNVVFQHIQNCRLGFVGAHAKSGNPRVIVEYMAAGIPIVMLDDINVDVKYIPNFFCTVTNHKNLRDTIFNALKKKWDTGTIVKHFEDNFTIEKCAEDFVRHISLVRD